MAILLSINRFLEALPRGGSFFYLLLPDRLNYHDDGSIISIVDKISRNSIKGLKG